MPISSGDTEQLEIVNPRWIKPTMSVCQAANQAAHRGYTLRASWDRVQGIRIVAVKREAEK